LCLPAFKTETGFEIIPQERRLAPKGLIFGVKFNHFFGDCQGISSKKNAAIGGDEVSDKRLENHLGSAKKSTPPG
jgi:hypothetical protein